MGKYVILLLSLVQLGLSSCRFEEDSEFIPSTEICFFLFQENGEVSLASISDSTLRLNIAESYGAEAVGIHDMAGKENFLWLSLKNQQAISQYNLKTDEQQLFSLDSMEAVFLCPGEDILLISDTVNRQLGFLNMKSGELVRKKLNHQPGEAYYRSGKFFVSFDSTILASYQETAFALLDTLDCVYPIIHIDGDNRIGIRLHMREGSEYFEGQLDWNNSQWIEPSSSSPYRITHYTPYQRSFFEKEWAADVRVFVEGRIRGISATSGILDLEMDFLESRGYFLRENDFQVYDLEEGEIRSFQRPAEHLRKSFFYYPVGGR
ncbi:MAG: hypothetical protein AAFY71_06140 [Bacteroidota bacterium]